MRTFNHVHVKCFSWHHEKLIQSTSSLDSSYSKVGRSARLRCHHVTLNMNKYCCQYRYIIKKNNNRLLPGQLHSGVTSLFCGCNLSNPGRDESVPRNFQHSSKLSSRSYLFSVSFCFCPDETVSGIALFFSQNKKGILLLGNFRCPLCVSVWWWFGNRVFWLVYEEMKFEEGEEGAFTDSYRRARAPALYMRITGAGEHIKT